MVNGQCPRQRSFFPLLQVADEAVPRALAATGKVLLILRRFCRFQKEDFYQGSGPILPEMQPRLDDSRIVEDHECSLGQQLWQGAERRLADAASVIDEQLAAVALGERELCDALIGQRVVVIAYLYMLCVHKTAAKVQKN